MEAHAIDPHGAQQSDNCGSLKHTLEVGSTQPSNFGRLMMLGHVVPSPCSHCLKGLNLSVGLATHASIILI